MARRQRSVERAGRRDAAVDRVLAVVLFGLAASGVMSVLPAGAQRAVAHGSCTLLTVGLTDCAPSVILGIGTQLGPPRCAPLSALDAALPEVLSRTITTEEGLRLSRDVTRDGRVIISPSGSDAQAPDLWSGRRPPSVQVLEGVSVPAGTAWDLPGGRDEGSLVRQLREEHLRLVQKRSALSLLTTLVGSSGDMPPPPNRRTSSVRLDRLHLPGSTSPLPAPVDSAAPRATSRLRPVLDVDRSEPASVVTDDVDQITATSVALEGRGGWRQPVAGALRWTRDHTGSLTGLTMEAVSQQPLLAVSGARDPAAVDVVYVWLPLGTADESDIVEGWLARPGGAEFDGDVVLGLHRPDPTDRMQVLLASAAEVTDVQLTGVTVGRLAESVRSDARRGLRGDWSGATIAKVATVAPQPGGGPRTVAMETSCRTSASTPS